MAGLALALDLLATAGASAKSSLHSFSSLSSLPAALSASVGVSFLPSYPSFSPQFQTRDWTRQFAVCEEGVYVDSVESWTPPDSRWFPQLDDKETELVQKPYIVELKPLFSAFRPRALGATTVRACLVNFLPIVEAYIQPQEDDLEEDSDRPASLPVDPIVPLKRSATHVMREVSVITTRRVLERATVHFASRRLAWKLLKDVPKSAVRKAGREASKFRVFVGVTRTTFRGHALGVMANWVVQFVLDVHNYLRFAALKNKKDGTAEKASPQDVSKDFNKLVRKTAGNSLKGGASLVLASIGAGLGTILIKPSIGTWIGCAAGDLAGPFLIGMCFDSWIFYGTFSPPSQDP